MKILNLALATALTMGLSTAATAASVPEVEPNNSFATAQNLDGNFTTNFDALIGNSTTMPHATVISGEPGSNYDFYSFTVGAPGTSGTFDIDFGMPNFDSMLALYDSSLVNLFVHDDGGVTDPGSVHGFDSLTSYVFANAGTYYLSVGQWPGNSANTGTYQLHVSLESPGAVPEPATWAMMLMGFGGAGYSMRRRKAPARAFAAA